MVVISPYFLCTTDYKAWVSGSFDRTFGAHNM